MSSRLSRLSRPLMTPLPRLMKHLKEFPFNQARRITPKETESYRKAIEDKLVVKRRRRGRPLKNSAEKYRPVAIRLHPKVLEWAKTEGKKMGLGYQTVINRYLMKFAA